MKRTLAIVLAAAMLLSLAACGGASSAGAAPQSGTSAAGTSAQQGDAPQGGAEQSAPAAEQKPAEIVYPELIPQELAQNAEYQAMLEDNAVILYDGEVVTGSTAARAFIESYNNGGTDTLYCYRFWPTEPEYAEVGFCSVTGMEFACSGGKATISYGGREGNGNWNFDGKHNLSELSLNEYGVFVYRSEASSEPEGAQVVSNYEMYTNYAALRAAKEKYLSPILWDAACGNTFENIEGVTNWPSLFDDIYYYLDPDDNNGNMWLLYPNGEIPMSLVMDCLTRYFEVDKATVTDTLQINYLAATDALYYNGGKGGLLPDCRVTSCEETDGKTVIVYRLSDPFTGEPLNDYTLTVRLLEDGSFRYLSLVNE